MMSERSVKNFLFKLAIKIQPAAVAGISIKVSQDLIHTAVFAVKHLLNLLGAKAGEDFLGPGGELNFDLEGSLIAGQAVGIAQAGEGFVERIPGRPFTVEIKAGRLYFSLSQSFKAAAATFESAEVAVSVLILNFL